MLAMTLAFALMAQAPEPPPDIWTAVDPTRVCTISSFRRLGVGTARPNDAIETVLPLTVDGREVWRIIHSLARTIDDVPPTGAVPLDVYDLDRATLRPIRSEHRSPRPDGRPPVVTRFVYEADVARRLDDRGEEIERVALAGRTPLPEGPGSAAIFQAIRWREGLRFAAHAVNRFEGTGDARLHAVTVEVTGRSVAAVGARQVPVWVVAQAAADGSYRTVYQITVAAPHVIVGATHSAGNRRPFITEGLAMAQDPGCMATTD
ncbi:hypothetical protein RCO27_09520 [Sphingosinicella sp. LHD-64]|uniref:hypothetical protein n=1 Tax=Sphingosinicella sp. LHD-64 TaxID=3072139 RepID=UPI00280FB94B|nr:hypothetical protein [Sphingosinicella sp. LHD-64]MDQ8756468.1 hypothetical protein [Sphingosinicella sp. LHD-64]